MDFIKIESNYLLHSTTADGSPDFYNSFVYFSIGRPYIFSYLQITTISSFSIE